jgi:hypothetical protein
MRKRWTASNVVSIALVLLAAASVRTDARRNQYSGSVIGLFFGGEMMVGKLNGREI